MPLQSIRQIARTYRPRIKAWFSCIWKKVNDGQQEFAWGLAVINGGIIAVAGSSLGNLLAVPPTTCEVSHFKYNIEGMFILFGLLAFVGSILAMIAAIAKSKAFTMIALFYTGFIFLSVTIGTRQSSPEKIASTWTNYVAACRLPPTEWLWNPLPNRL
jgi:hypothetical protein